MGMPKPLAFTRTSEEIEVLAKAIKHDKRPEVRQRAMGLRLLHEGQSPQAVAALMSASLPTVYNWHHRWEAERVEGLANRPKSGRTRKADAAYLAVLAQVLEQDPQELGYPFTLWTAGRLRLHLQQETGILLSDTRFRVLLQENDFVYRRPKHDLKDLQDPQARDEAEKWLEELKKAPKKKKSTFSLWTKAP